MEWSPEQDRALTEISRWLQDPSRQVFRLFGYAGTGKTTLAKAAAEHAKGSVLFGAFTGKAAYVLRQKGCPGATTVHAHIYQSKERGKAKIKELESMIAELINELRSELALEDRDRTIDHPRILELRQKLEEERREAAKPLFSLNPESMVKDAGLYVLDEASMVDARMGADLMSFGTKILVLGDPAQLPPIMGAGYFTDGHEPDFLLQEIHRQARGNPILELAYKARTQQWIQPGRYGSSVVLEEGVRMDPQEVMAADQILVGRNATRYSSNRRARQLRGITDDVPIPGDKLVCLRNNHEVGLLNGALWYVQDVGEVDRPGSRMTMTVIPDSETAEGAKPLTAECHMQHFLNQTKDLAWWDRKNAEEFDFGYALTVHKSQGSQWNNVVLFDESFCFRADRWKWLYTGITRAANSLTMVRV